MKFPRHVRRRLPASAPNHLHPGGSGGGPGSPVPDSDGHHKAAQPQAEQQHQVAHFDAP